MDLYLLTSRAEGLPNTLVEAQMMGVPVVTTPAGGAPETFIHGKTGFVLESADREQAARLLVRLLQDTDWRAKAGLKATAFARSAFGIDRAIDETIAVYAAGLEDTNWSEKWTRR
jgi:glycosyltransferase involved in cell wall biosynthesis